MTSALGNLRHELDQQGCEYGRVTRARLETLASNVDGVRRDVDRVDTKLNAILSIVGIQLLAFCSAVVIFLLYHSVAT